MLWQACFHWRTRTCCRQRRRRWQPSRRRWRSWRRQMSTWSCGQRWTSLGGLSILRPRTHSSHQSQGSQLCQAGGCFRWTELCGGRRAQREKKRWRRQNPRGGWDRNAPWLIKLLWSVFDEERERSFVFCVGWVRNVPLSLFEWFEGSGCDMSRFYRRFVCHVWVEAFPLEGWVTFGKRGWQYQSQIKLALTFVEFGLGELDSINVKSYWPLLLFVFNFHVPTSPFPNPNCTSKACPIKIYKFNMSTCFIFHTKQVGESM